MQVSCRKKVHFRGGGRKTLSIYRVEENLYEIHRRLEEVIIEKLPWQRCLESYDKNETVFFLDPPYYGCKNDYGRGVFEKSDFAMMAEILSALQGKFILTLNDMAETRQMFGRFNIEAEKIKYSVSGRPQEVSQLIISN